MATVEGSLCPCYSSSVGVKLRATYSTSTSAGKGTLTITKLECIGVGGQTVNHNFSYSISLAGSSVASGSGNTGGTVSSYTVWSGSKSSSVTKTAGGSATIRIQASDSFYYNGSSKTATLDTTITISNIPAAYTACSAPTACTVSPTLVAAGVAKAVTVSWSGASGGTNNSITGYDVVFNGTTTSVSSTSSSGSITFTSPSSRGSSYTAQVRTKGSAGSSYYSGYKTSTNSVKVNRLPNAPTISGSNQTIASDAPAVTVTLTKGTDPDGSTTTLYYNSSNSHTGQISSSSAVNYPLDPLPGTSATVYAWTYDGIEYNGSAVTRTITRKSPASLSYYDLKISQRSGCYKGENEVGTTVQSFLLKNCSLDPAWTKFTYWYTSSDNPSDFSGAWAGGPTGLGSYSITYDKEFFVFNSKEEKKQRLPHVKNFPKYAGWICPDPSKKYFKIGISFYDSTLGSWTSIIPFDEIFVRQSDDLYNWVSDIAFDTENEEYTVQIIVPTTQEGQAFPNKVRFYLLNDSDNAFAKYEQGYTNLTTFVFQIPKTTLIKEGTKWKFRVVDSHGIEYGEQTGTIQANTVEEEE